MNPDNKPQAEQLLDSLINCVLLLDNDLIIRYANQSAMQLFAQSARKLTGTPLPILYSYLSLDTAAFQATLAEGHSFTDNDVTLVVNNQMHALSLSAQPVSGDFILLELTPLDSHRRITQNNYNRRSRPPPVIWCADWRTKSKIRSAGYAVPHSCYPARCRTRTAGIHTGDYRTGRSPAGAG